MNEKKEHVVRLNIYVNDPLVRRRVKTAAARRDVSISDYCLGAIVSRLVKDGELAPGEQQRARQAAVEKARLFHVETFGGRKFRVSSARLIREARENGSA